jgi:hypothetical protein
MVPIAIDASNPGHQEHQCTKINKNNKVTNVKSICFDSCYLLTKGEKGVKLNSLVHPLLAQRRRQFGYQRVWLLTSKDPRRYGYLKCIDLFCR